MITYNIIDKNFEKIFAIDLHNTLKNQKIILFCVGCDKWTVDSFAPMVASILKYKFNINYMIFGELGNCITKSNYLQYYQTLKSKFPTHKILVIDTALCDYDNVGLIRFSKSGLKVGSALHKDCNKLIGDFYISANIDILPFNNTRLPMTSLSKVLLYAEKVSKALYYAFSTRTNY